MIDIYNFSVIIIFTRNLILIKTLFIILKLVRKIIFLYYSKLYFSSDLYSELPKQGSRFFYSVIDYLAPLHTLIPRRCFHAVEGTFRHVAISTIMFHNEANVRYPMNNWFVVLGESEEREARP